MLNLRGTSLLSNSPFSKLYFKMLSETFVCSYQTIVLYSLRTGSVCYLNPGLFSNQLKADRTEICVWWASNSVIRLEIKKKKRHSTKNPGCHALFQHLFAILPRTLDTQRRPFCSQQGRHQGYLGIIIVLATAIVSFNYYKSTLKYVYD